MVLFHAHHVIRNRCVSNNPPLFVLVCAVRQVRHLAVGLTYPKLLRSRYVDV